jgi:hypothetical protein
LIAPNYVDSRISVARAQAPFVQSTDDLLRTYGADVPRFNASGRAPIEGQRTNSISNSRGEGAVPGVPGTLPPDWAYPATTGMGRQVVGSGTIGNLTYVDWRVFSASAPINFEIINFRQVMGLSASAGTPASVGGFVQVVGGSLANISSTQFRVVWTGGGIQTQTIAPDTVLRRFTHTFTAPVSTTAFAAHGLALNFSAGAAIDVTLRLAWPTVELGAPFASSVILPAAGAPAASTRGADLVTAALASLGIGGNGACTMLGTFMIPQAAPPGAPQVLWQMDVGGPSNRWTLTNPGGTAFLQLVRVTADVAAGASAAAFTPGAIVRVGVSINGSGGGSMSFNGASAVSVSGGPTSGLTTKRLGNRDDGVAPLNGEIGHLQILPYAVSDTELQARVAALPLT